MNRIISIGHIILDQKCWARTLPSSIIALFLENLDMSLTSDDVKKIAHLARLNLSEADNALYAKQLSTILHFIEQMNQADTDSIDPIAHSLDLTQRLRMDEISEIDQRDIFQSIAPRVEAGLYLVPKVIDEE